MRHPSIDDPAAFYREARARSRQLFELITPDAYYDRPIRLRTPIVFYEGHLPAFSVNTLVKLTMKRRGIDDAFETLLQAAFLCDVTDQTELACCVRTKGFAE